MHSKFLPTTVGGFLAALLMGSLFLPLAPVLAHNDDDSGKGKDNGKAWGLSEDFHGAIQQKIEEHKQSIHDRICTRLDDKFTKLSEKLNRKWPGWFHFPLPAFCRGGGEPPVVEPSVSIDASPLSLLAGATTTLTWSSAHTSGSCEASDGWSGGKALSGGEDIVVNATTTYTISCGNGTATSSDSVMVSVTPVAVAPTASLLGSPLAIIEGATSTLSWTSTHATSCTASDGWSGGKALLGDEIVAPTATTTYTLACSGAGGTATSSVTVGVTPVSSNVIGHVVLSEIFYDVDAAHGGEPGNEWIELYNPLAVPVDLTGWYLSDANGTSTKDTLLATTTIASHGFLFVTDATTTEGLWSIPSSTPVVSFESPLGNGLGNTGDALYLFDAFDALVDQISWGSNTDAFSPSVTGVPEGHSLYRTQFSTDTNTAADWGNASIPTPGGI